MQKIREVSAFFVKVFLCMPTTNRRSVTENQSSKTSTARPTE